MPKEPTYLGTIQPGVHIAKRKSQRLHDKMKAPVQKIPRREGLNTTSSANNQEAHKNQFKGISNGKAIRQIRIKKHHSVPKNI